MFPARSCYSCHYAGTERGPNCKVASDRLCCGGWTEPKNLKIVIPVEFKIDVREIAEQYGESLPASHSPEELNNWFQDIFKLSVSEFILKRLVIEDDHHALSIFDVVDNHTDTISYVSPSILKPEQGVTA